MPNRAILAIPGLTRGLIWGLAGLLALAAVPAHAEPTLAAVKKRGQLLCGINGQLPGFSVQNERKEWAGFEIDYCRAVAAAALGDGSKVRFVPLTAVKRFDALRDGSIDVLMRNTTASLERTAGTGVRDVTVIYVDAQAVVVPKALNIKEVAELDGKTVCVLRGTPYLPRLQEWFAERKRAIVPAMFDTQREMYQAFYDGKCIGITQDISALTSTVIASGRANDYAMLPDLVARDPLAPYVHALDPEWLDVVRWTHFALLDEELGITQNNVDEQLRSPLPSVQRLLGVAPVNGKLLGLDEDRAYKAIKQVGNYAEIYERNVGKGSALKFARGVNALWSRGGVMYPLPMQ
jgi:general L-amino acid transport system substrate-binding protein